MILHILRVEIKLNSMKEYKSILLNFINICILLWKDRYLFFVIIYYYNINLK